MFDKRDKHKKNDDLAAILTDHYINVPGSAKKSGMGGEVASGLGWAGLSCKIVGGSSIIYST